MLKFTKKDLLFSLFTGFTSGIILWLVLRFLGRSLPLGIPTAILVIIVPVAWIIGVNFGYFLGRWMPFFNQFGKFVAVGFTNFFIDTGVLNLEISLSGINDGWHYSFFKTISFIVAVTNSYILNKNWVFEASASGKGRSELIKFMAVNVFAIVLNVGIASFVVNYVHPFGGLDDNTWANVGSVIGSACAIVLTFVGSRLIVFKKDNVIPQVPSTNF